MAWRLFKLGVTRGRREPRMFTAHDKLRPTYDVVIIGGGGHGLAAAYYLARDHGITLRDVSYTRPRQGLCVMYKTDTCTVK